MIITTQELTDTTDLSIKGWQVCPARQYISQLCFQRPKLPISSRGGQIRALPESVVSMGMTVLCLSCAQPLIFVTEIGPSHAHRQEAQRAGIRH
jgi:hypothetical protein